MRVIDWLNQLAADRLLVTLYKANVVTARTYAYRELMLYYTRLAELPHLVDDPAECARRTATECEVNLSTVYKARREMEKELKEPSRLRSR